MVRGRLIAALAIGLTPLMMIPTASQAQVFIGVSVHIGPPPLPFYAQPPIPAPNYIWAPGYWAWDDWWGDYYWVPGTWVMAPRPGLLWTPGYWGWNDGAYAFHGGYWGPHVGWYGGISYGFGYTGSGYEGGEWRGGNFYYNRLVNNVSSTRITNVYNRTVINNTTIINNNHVSYSGGPGGVTAQPTPEQRMAMNEPHIAATPQQVAHVHAAQANRSAFASVNRGRPAELAVARPHAAPAGPIHPAGMARPAPGGGLPGPGTRGGDRQAPGTPRAEGYAEKPQIAGTRPEQSNGMSDGIRQHEAATPKAPAHDAEDRAYPSEPKQARPVERTEDSGMREGNREDRAPPAEQAYQPEPRPHPQAEPHHAPEARPHPQAEPHYAPPPHHQEQPHNAPPPHHSAPPPEHHAPPHEGGGGHEEHHHD